MSNARSEPWTLEMDLILWRGFCENETDADLSKIIGRSAGALQARRQHLRRISAWDVGCDTDRRIRELPRRGWARPLTPDDYAAIKKYRRDGLTWEAIGNRLGVSGKNLQERMRGGRGYHGLNATDVERHTERAACGRCPVSVTADTPEAARAFTARLVASVGLMRSMRGAV